MEQLLPVYPVRHSQVKLEFPSTHSAVPNASHGVGKQKSISPSQKSPSHPGKQSQKKPPIALEHVPLLQSTVSHGEGAGDIEGDTIRSVVAVTGKIIVIISTSVAVGITKKSVSKMLTS